jgi:hypothetical protein
MDTMIYADPAMPTAPAPPPRPPGSALRTVAWLVALAVFGGGVWFGMSKAFAKHDWLYHEGVRLHTPATVGGYPKMSSSMATRLEWEIKADATRADQAQAGVYGADGVPRYLLVAAVGPETSGRQVLARFRGAFDGATLGKATVTSSGLACQTVTDASKGMHGALCAWAGSRSTGLVVSFRQADLKKVAATTAVARSGVEAA